MKKRRKLLFTLFLPIALVGFIATTFYFTNHKINDTMNASMQTIEVTITDIIVSQKQTTLFVTKDNTSSRIYLKESTIIKDSSGKKLDTSNLKIGMTISAKVNPTVMYLDQVNIETGKSSEISVYYQCYEIEVN